MTRQGVLRIPGTRAARLIRPLLARLPRLEGREIQVRFLPLLSAWRGRLLSRDFRGSAVHAGSDIPKRRMVLDTQLLTDPAELERIVTHEIYHFVWVRLGNPVRWSYEKVLERQFRARGELGWSAEGAKSRLTPADRKDRSRRWREYVCESFCDTAAWMHSRRSAHPEWTLAAGHRCERRAWFERNIGAGRLLL